MSLLKKIWAISLLSTITSFTNAQIELKPVLKAGIRTYGNNKFRDAESPGLSETTWYTYSAMLFAPKYHIALEGTFRESGRYAFLKVPSFLITKPKNPIINPVPRLVEEGDVLVTIIEFYPHWLSVSFNCFPTSWKKHHLFVGGTQIKRKGGLWVVDYVVDHAWGREAFINTSPDVSQKSILWQTEYLFTPFKFTALSLKCNYAYFTKFPHSYYEVILSIGTHLNFKI